VKPSEAASGGRGRPGAFIVVAAVLAAFLAGASAPSPLYGVYARNWGFSPVTVTAVFAIYAIALLGTLLVSGTLSDALGRRPVILSALGLQSLAMILFLLATGVTWLYLARIAQGIATGLVTAAVSAALLDLQPADRPGRGPLMNAVMPTAGLAVGGLIAGLLVQYAPQPMRLVYLVLLISYLGLAAAMVTVPESVTTRSRLSLIPRVGVDPPNRPAFLAATPCLVACWALGGLYLSLGPSLIMEIEHSANLMLGGAVVVALCGAGVISCLIVRSWPPATTMLAGCAVLIGGVIVTMAGVAAGSGAVLLIGSVIAGAGFGSGFLGTFRHLVNGAEPRTRAGLIAAIYVVAYLAFAVPAVIAGVAARAIGLVPTTFGYAAMVAALAAASMIAELVRARAAVPAS